MKRERPFVLINMAMSADGKIASTSRRLISLGTKRDYDNMLKLRATVDAVMCGAKTIASGNITMDAGGKKYEQQRINNGLNKQNLRVLISGSGSISPNASIFQNRNSPIIIFVSKLTSANNLVNLRKVADEVLVYGNKKVLLNKALKYLYQKWNSKRVLCEGGGELNFDLIRLGLVDELHLTICPSLLGGRDAPTIVDGTGFSHLTKVSNLELTNQKRIGNELFTTWKVRPRSDSQL